MPREFTQDGTPVHNVALHTYTQTPTPTQRIANLPTTMFLGGGRKPENLEETYIDTRKTCTETPQRQ